MKYDQLKKIEMDLINNTGYNSDVRELFELKNKIALINDLKKNNYNIRRKNHITEIYSANDEKKYVAIIVPSTIFDDSGVLFEFPTNILGVTRKYESELVKQIAKDYSIQ